MKVSRKDPKCAYCQNRTHCAGEIQRYQIPNGATYCTSFVMDGAAFEAYLKTVEVAR